MIGVVINGSDTCNFDEVMMMRHSVWVGLLGSLMVLGSAPVQAQAEPEVNCNDPQTTLEMSICAGRLKTASEKAMQAAYQKVRQSYQTELANDAKIPELQTYHKQRLQQLTESQRAWLSYRKAHCNWVTSKVAGGTIAPSIGASCITRLNQERTTSLLQDLEE
jgi:uncharacterized protein YecT (DUF1311 family)